MTDGTCPACGPAPLRPLTRCGHVLMCELCCGLLVADPDTGLRYPDDPEMNSLRFIPEVIAAVRACRLTYWRLNLPTPTRET